MSTVLVIMMSIPGLALFYGGLVRKKNVLGTMMQSFVMMAIVTLIWGICGYSLVFGEGNAFIADLRYMFLNGVGGAPNTDGVDPSGSHHLIQNCDIFVGDDDHFVVSDMSHRSGADILAKGIPGAKRATFPRSGHLVPILDARGPFNPGRHIHTVRADGRDRLRHVLGAADEQRRALVQRARGEVHDAALAIARRAAGRDDTLDGERDRSVLAKMTYSFDF